MNASDAFIRASPFSLEFLLMIDGWREADVRM